MRLLLLFAITFTPLLHSEEVADRIQLLSEGAAAVPGLETITDQRTPLPGITAFRLSNGMRVVLRPNSESESIQLSLLAPGGTWSFPTPSTIAAKYAGTFALHSSYPGVSPDQLSAFLFRYSIEIAPRTRPFHRHVDTSFLPEHTRLGLALLHHFFLDMAPQQEGMDTALAGIEDAMLHRSHSCEARFEDTYLTVNSSGHPSMLPTSQEQVRSITLDDARETFYRSFRNPAEFTLVAVGPIDLQDFTQQILHYLGTIPVKDDTSPLLQGAPPPLSFPRGVLHRAIPCSQESESFVRITFPIRFPLTQENYPQFEVATQMMEQKLRKAISQEFDSTQAVDVQYHLPTYPFIDTVWLTIQYRSTQGRVEILTKLCLDTLEELRTQEVSDEEIQQVRLLFNRMNDYWLQQDSYWMQTIANHLFWDWPLRCIEESCTQQQRFSSAEMQQILRQIIDLSDHTILTLQP
jgi:predicted Zn-dependent peptidase